MAIDPQLRSAGVAAAGTTQATAATVLFKHALVTTVGAGSGVVLQEYFCSNNQAGTIFNGASPLTGENLLIYPWSGATFNGQTADRPLSLPAGKGCMWVYLNSTTIGIIFS